MHVRSGVKRVTAAVGAVAAVGVAVPTVANAGTYGLSNQSSATSHNYRAYVSGTAQDYGCGFLSSKDCGKVTNMYGSVLPYGSTLATAAQLKLEAGMSGLGLNVFVGNSGAGVGFTDWGSSCGTGWVTNQNQQVTLTANGEVCKGDTYGYVSTIFVKTHGQYRIGKYDWFSVSAYSSVSVGGF